MEIGYHIVLINERYKKFSELGQLEKSCRVVLLLIKFFMNKQSRLRTTSFHNLLVKNFF
jgi:hypothetical protein